MAFKSGDKVKFKEMAIPLHREWSSGVPERDSGLYFWTYEVICYSEDGNKVYIRKDGFVKLVNEGALQRV
jgi:hypothetical protein